MRARGPKYALQWEFRLVQCSVRYPVIVPQYVVAAAFPSGVALGGACVRAVAGYTVHGKDHVVTAHSCTDDATDSTDSLFGPVSGKDLHSTDPLQFTANTYEGKL